jgi:hypothetical protein
MHVYICPETHVTLFQTRTHVIQIHVLMDAVSGLVMDIYANAIMVTLGPLAQVVVLINRP